MMEPHDYNGTILAAAWLVHLLERPRGRAAFARWARMFQAREWAQWAEQCGVQDDDGLGLEAVQSLQRTVLEAGRLGLDRLYAQLEAQLALSEDAMYADGDEGAPDSPEPPPEPPAA